MMLRTRNQLLFHSSSFHLLSLSSCLPAFLPSSGQERCTVVVVGKEAEAGEERKSLFTITSA